MLMAYTMFCEEKRLVIIIVLQNLIADKDLAVTFCEELISVVVTLVLVDSSKSTCGSSRCSTQFAADSNASSR